MLQAAQPDPVKDMPGHRFTVRDAGLQGDMSTTLSVVSLLNEALQRHSDTRGAVVGRVNDDAGSVCFHNVPHNTLPFFSLTKIIREIKQELAAGWRESNGYYCKTQGWADSDSNTPGGINIRLIMDACYANPEDALLRRIGDESHTARQWRARATPDTIHTLREQWETAPITGVVLTERQVNTAAEIIGFRSPARSM